MINMDINRICRVCLLENDNMKSLFNKNKFTDLCKKLEYCTLIKISVEEDFPLNICLLCVDKLEIAYNFKLRYELSYSTLQNIFQKKTVNNLQLRDKRFDDLVITSNNLNDKLRKRKLINHIESQHSINNNIITNEAKLKHLCNFCGYLCASRSVLNSHMIKHSDKFPYSCELCGKKYKSRASKSFHLKSHKNEKKHYCNQCGKSYANSSGLKYHTRLHENNKRTNVKLFQCKECYKSFANEKDLKTHIILHSGDFPFVCDICSRGFNRINNYKMHKRRHSGIKSFVCDTCGFALFTSSALKIHIRSLLWKNPTLVNFVTVSLLHLVV